MPENIGQRIVRIADDLYRRIITDNVIRAIDRTAQTPFGNISPDDLKAAIKSRAEGIQRVLRDCVRDYERRAAEITTEAESSKAQSEKSKTEYKTEKADLTSKLESSKAQSEKLQSEYKTEIADLTSKLESSKEQSEKSQTEYSEQKSILEQDLKQVEDAHYRMLRVYEAISAGIADSLKATVKALPDDEVEPLLTRLYELEEDTPLIRALEFRCYEIDEKAEAEDNEKKVEIGKVTEYSSDLGIVIELKESLGVGDWVGIKGTETDYERQIESLKRDDASIEEAAAGDKVELKFTVGKVSEEAKAVEGDIVYKVYQVTDKKSIERNP